MCDVLDKVENRGIAKGKIEGEMEGKAQVTTLMKKLFEQNRIDDAKKASEDAAYCDRLLKEFGMMQQMTKQMTKLSGKRRKGKFGKFPGGLPGLPF